jgi:hypothetical protein
VIAWSVAGQGHYLSTRGGVHEQTAHLWIRLPLPATGRFVVRRKSTGVTVMAEKQQEPAAGSATEDGHNNHPVEPAEGAREPCENADEPRPPHPDEPAEGER